MEHDTRRMEHDTRCMAHGAWRMAHGACGHRTKDLALAALFGPCSAVWSLQRCLQVHVPPPHACRMHQPIPLCAAILKPAPVRRGQPACCRRRTRVPAVKLCVPGVVAEVHMRCVHDDDHVATVGLGRVNRLVLALQQAR
eukprot:363818-Chlamydomonas_euryale.AAC.5